MAVNNAFVAVIACVCAFNKSPVRGSSQYLDDVAVVTSDIFPLLPNFALWSDNEQCRDDSRLLLANLHNSTTWALQMLEASSRSAVGVLKGRTYQLGDYDECVETVSPIHGRYCLATVTVSRPPHAVAADSHADFYNPTASAWDKINYVHASPLKMPRNVVYWALCVPASCTPDDVQASIELHLAATSGNTSDVTTRVVVDAALCRTNEEAEFSYGSIVFCGFLVVLLIVVTSSTLFSHYFIQSVYDLKAENNNKDPTTNSYFLCFALQRNISDFVEPPNPHNSLMFLNGIKHISMCIIIACHRFGSLQGFAIQNFETIERNSDNMASNLLYQLDLAVDTFFLLSGLMVTYIVIPRKPFNVISAIILRYMRLTPVYMVVVFFCSTVMYRMGDGPMWNSVIGTESDACRENWWTNLLYISNYVNEDRMCMVHSWYLPCDMHFFILALLAIKTLQTCPKIGCVILGFATTVSIIIPFTITYVGNKAPLLYFYRDFLVSPRTHDVFLTMYIKSHNRASAYLVGIATGYFLSTTKDSKGKFQSKSCVCMLVGCCICVAALIPGGLFYNPDWKYEVIEASLVAGLRRFTWAVGMSLVVVSLHFNNNSTIGAFLSSRPMVSLGKLTYSTYLVHMIVQAMHVASLRSPHHITVFSYIHLVLGDIACSLGIALVLYLTVESPLRLLCKQIVTTQKKIPPVASPTFNYVLKLDHEHAAL